MFFRREKSKVILMILLILQCSMNRFDTMRRTPDWDSINVTKSCEKIKRLRAGILVAAIGGGQQQNGVEFHHLNDHTHSQ